MNLCQQVISTIHDLQHFLDGKPTKENPNPVAADPYSNVKRARKAPSERNSTEEPSSKKKRLEFTQNDVGAGCSSQLTTPTGEENAAEALILLGETANPPVDNLVYTKPVNLVAAADPMEAVGLHKPAADLATTPIKTKIERHVKARANNKKLPVLESFVSCPKCSYQFEPSLKERQKLRRKEFIKEILTDDSKCQLYTGIPKSGMLQDIFTWILPKAKTIKLWYGTGDIKNGRTRTAMTLLEEMILTLVRIRRGYDTSHIAYIFGISQSQVSRVFLAWCKLLAGTFKPLIIWPSKDLVYENLPDTFMSYPNTRVIIDATEFHIKKPFRPTAQKQTWSNYKHANTLKLLVGIMPSGAITFVSKLYSGCISDLHITEQSGLVHMLEEGDDVMADRGFNIRHLLLPKRCTLNIPSFSHGKRLTLKGLRQSRRIASVRIHVERAIRRMKTFKILSGIIPLKLRFSLDDVITIVSLLCNLHPRLA